MPLSSQVQSRSNLATLKCPEKPPHTYPDSAPHRSGYYHIYSNVIVQAYEYFSSPTTLRTSLRPTVTSVLQFLRLPPHHKVYGVRRRFLRNALQLVRSTRLEKYTQCLPFTLLCAKDEVQAHPTTQSDLRECLHVRRGLNGPDGSVRTPQERERRRARGPTAMPTSWAVMKPISKRPLLVF